MSGQDQRPFDTGDPLYVLWCNAVDAVQSDDFRDETGALDEDAYTQYQREAIARTRERLLRGR